MKTVNRLGVFAKYWRPGGVKTRLARRLGALPASRLYRAFLEALLDRLSAVGDDRILVYSPPEQREAFARLSVTNWRLAPQVSGDLGDRMTAFFEDNLQSGAARVVLLGSDSPTVPVEYIERAFDELADHAVVLGPSRDGGYYLVGASVAVPPIFSGIRWSTADVWPQTMDRLAREEISFAVLPQWYDVDELEDLRRLRDELAGVDCGHRAPDDLLAAIEAVLG